MRYFRRHLLFLVAAALCLQSAPLHVEARPLSPYLRVIGPLTVGDETTAITTGTAKLTFRMPCKLKLTAIRGSLTTADSSGANKLTVDINEAGTTVISTKLTWDATEKTTTTAAVAYVISDSSLADDAEMTVDVDSLGTGADAAGLKITLIGYEI